jgi:hypothetical protein
MEEPGEAPEAGGQTVELEAQELTGLHVIDPLWVVNVRVKSVELVGSPVPAASKLLTTCATVTEQTLLPAEQSLPCTTA